MKCLKLALIYLYHYRSTPMHSGDYAVARCLSVHLSVHHTPVLCLNDYTYTQSFNEILIGTNTCPTQQCHFE